MLFVFGWWFQGMAHLESKQIVHRDLAARNVLGTMKQAIVII